MESRTRINHRPLATSRTHRSGRCPLYLSLLSAIAAFFIMIAAAPAAESETLTLKHLRTLTNDFAITTLAWHPDGRQLAVGQVLNKRVAIWDTRTGERVRTLETEPGGAHTLAYSPDGKYLAVGREFSRLTPDRVHVHLYDAASGNLLQRFPPSAPVASNATAAEALAFSSDSRFLAASGHGSPRAVAVYEVATKSVFASSPDVPKSGGTIEAIVFSPDSRYLALGRNTGAMEIWTVSPWKMVRRVEGQTGGIHALVFSPNGRYLASGTNVGERWDWSQRPARQMFAKFNDDIVLWSVPAFEKSAEFPSRRFKHTPLSTIIESLQFSPHGRLLLVGARAKSIEIIDVTNGKTALFKDGFDAIAEPVFSPEGKHLAIGLGKKIEIHELIAR